MYTVLPLLFTDFSRNQPQRVLPYSAAVTGGTCHTLTIPAQVRCSEAIFDKPVSSFLSASGMFSGKDLTIYSLRHRFL